MNKNFLAVVLVGLASGLSAFASAQQAPGTAAPSSPPASSSPGQVTAEGIGYVGAATRIGLGYDDTTHLRGELYRLFTESDTSALLGEAWISGSAGGLKLSYNWLPERWSPGSADPTVRKFFLAADRNDEGDAKVTLGGGFERQSWFGGLYGSAGVTGRRRVTDTTVSSIETIQGNDGRPFLQDITTSVRTQIFERPYDYGVGARLGRFYDSALLRLTLGADYEWGRDSAHQTTVSVGLEKFFAGAPYSVAVNLEHYRKSGGFDLSGSDNRVMAMLRYEFGGPVFRPSRETRQVEVAPKEAPPVPAAPAVAAAPATPPPAVVTPAPVPPKKETRLVKTTASMSADAFFEFDKSTLTPAARSALDGVIARLKASGFEGNLHVTGHTCDIGSAAYNQGLSERRANAVRDYLVSNGGIPRDRILAEGKGLREPRYPNTRAERHKNRRVDLEFVTYEDKVEEYLVAGSPATVTPAPQPAPVAQPATQPVPPAPVEWRREVIEHEPPWLRRALRQSVPHKQTVDVYRQQEQSTTVTQGDKRYLNRPPVAANDSYAVPFGSTGNSLDVLANDSDPDGDTLSITSVGAPQHGSATIAGARISYTPAAGYSGADSFSYTISDGKGGTASATVSITVTAVVANRPPVAQNDAFTVNQDSAGNSFNVLANDTDPDGDALTISAVGTAGHGTATISGNRVSYTPAAGFAGSDAFTYTISDGRGGTATASVAITVVAIVANHPPVAQNDAYAVDQDSGANSLNVLANDSDADGDALTIAAITAPGHGTASISGGRISYAPAPGYAGSDSFTYTVSDGRGGTATATVTITVRTVAVNHPPVARDDSYFIRQKFTDLDVLANDSDPDGDALTIVAVTQPPFGTVTIASDGKSVRYTQPFMFNHTSFTYTISDGRGGTATATVQLIDP